MNKNLIVISLIISLLASSCAYQQVIKKGTPKEKFEYAQKLYKKGDYGRTLPLLEELIGSYDPGIDPEAVYFRYAFTHFNLGDFMLAGYHFDNFARNYFRSSLAEEASYMSARCEYHKSLPYNLDQTSTLRAVDRIQLFIDKHPQSKFIPECNTLIDNLRTKLHQKAYDNAMLYYKMGTYKSAIVSFKNAILEYPDIPQKEEIEFLIINSEYLYAANSILSSQPARFEKVIVDASEYLKNKTLENKKEKEVRNLIDKSKKGKLEAEKELQLLDE